MSTYAIDSGNSQADDASMSAVTDKDYIDAKLQAASAQMLGEVRQASAEVIGNLKEYQAQSIARMTAMEQTMRSGATSLEDGIDTRFAQFEANLQRALSETIKWVAGTVIAGVTVSVSVTSFLLHNAGPKSAPVAPIVVYAQPAQAPTVPSTPSAPTTNPK